MVSGKSAHFHIVYDGPALDGNEMAVKDLAPALIALSDVIEESNRVINGGRAKVAINVKASFKTGCFGVELSVVQGVIMNIIDIVTSDQVVNGVELLGLLGLSIPKSRKYVKTSLLNLIKWINGRSIKKIIRKDDGTSTIIIDDDEKDVENKVIDLLKSVDVRKNLEKVVEPLSKDGIDSFACTDSEMKESYFSIGHVDRDAFKAPVPEDNLLDDQVIETNVHMLNIAFQADNKWRFSDGSNHFYAEIKHKEFLSQVEKNEIAFRKDDILKVSLRRRQWLTESGIKTEYTILEVLDRKSAAVQLKLPFDDHL
jgi:hypothetical protein